MPPSVSTRTTGAATGADADPQSGAPARKRRGFPVLPTLMVAIALPTLVGLGSWQLARHHWKDGLLAEYRRNIDAAPLDLGSTPIPPDSQFRRARLLLSCPSAVPAERAGRTLDGRAGFANYLPCRSGSLSLQLDAGWSPRPFLAALPAFSGGMTGRLIPDADGGWILIGESALPPLLPSAPPTLDSIPNNHLSYAVQWFGFAAVLAAIYGLWLFRWLAPQRGPA